ncbi:hypothetical protein GE09DRAFT_1180297 [Coniochaeta sp. 2T2.1]|nr:hypothetical protein GE09DRAFT_1180297 [Coniochaeta sp. 2T2.1]
MPEFRVSSVVKLPGLYFQAGPIFSNDMDVSHRIFAALAGDDASNLSLDDAKGRASQSLETLVETVLHYRDLYRALRGNKDCWDVITDQAKLYALLSADEVKLLLMTVARARDQYAGQAAPTRLTQLLDDFITLKKETIALGPPVAFNVSVHPLAAAEHEATQAIQSLESNLLAMNVSTKWPPSYFSSKDLIVLTHHEVMAALGGVDRTNTQPREQFPPADCRNLPALIRLQLCHLALTKYANKDWKLFLSPVGFLDDSSRRKWYTVAGQQTKVFVTAKYFLTYADEALRRSKFNVMGMFCHWVLQDLYLTRVVDIVRHNPTELWTDWQLMRRYATVVILRHIPTPLGMRVHVVWYDPSMEDVRILQRFEHDQEAIANYRAHVMEMLEEWAAENRIEIESRYRGGPVSNEAGVSGDSVRQCFHFIERVTSGRWFELPEPDDEQALLNMGFVKMESTLQERW